MLYANAKKRQFIPTPGNNEAQAVSLRPILIYGTKLYLDILFCDDDGEPLEFSESDTFECAGDNNFTHSDDLMFYSGPERCFLTEVPGVLRFEIYTNTTAFKTKAGEKATQSTIHFQVRRYLAGETLPDTILQDTFYALGSVMGLDDKAPESADPEYYTSAQIRALLNAGYEMEFSADGESWHAGQADGDLYYHYRNRKIGGEWSDKIMTPKGEKGDKGDKGDTGDPGAEGKSAYQLWLEQEGNEGKTLDDFFNAYRGSDGTGLTVRGAYDAASTYQKTDTATDAVQYNGSLWGYINAAAGSGNAPPESAATVSNDYWTLLVAKGETGSDGRGIVSVEKTGTSGKVDTYTITYTDETTSTFTVTNGTDGTDGKTILNGTGAPSNNLGTDGDFYLDTNALNLYLKVSGAWTLQGSLAAGLQFAVAQADGDESTKTVPMRTVTVSADGSSVYSGEAQTVLYDFNIPTEEA